MIMIYYLSKNLNTLTLINNKTYINENIFIPSGYLINIRSNEEIILTNNAFIFSNSPWHAIGLKGKIAINGLTDNFGGGLIIKNTKKKFFIYQCQVFIFNRFKRLFIKSK